MLMPLAPLKPQLHQYQIEGAQFLAERKFAICGDKMGYGKSAQAIAACDIVKAQTVTVICPSILKSNWQREFARFSHRHLECTIMKTMKDAIPPTGIFICSFEMASDPDIKKKLNKRGCDVLIIDEVHALKDPGTKRTAAVYGAWCSRQHGIIETAKQCWGLSGTLAPNSAAELYTHFKMAGEWTDGYQHFIRHFCEGKDTKYGFKATGNKNVAELRAKLAKFMIRRSADVLTLPPLNIGEVLVEGMSVDPTLPVLEKLAELEPEAARVIERAIRENDFSLADTPMVSTARRLIGLAKVRPVFDMVCHELDNGLESIVIFAIHRDVLKYLQAMFREKGVKCGLIFGGTPDERKQQILDGFAKPISNMWKRRVLLLQIKTAGQGLNITTCSHVLIAEADWTPGTNVQAIARCHRMGQPNPVFARFVTLSGSVDEAVNAVLKRKTTALSEIYA